ncbi:MAG: AraC family transcriptional regulator [Chryseobacterium sp.]|nr:MAG: AraC family transcriptional regulator [Chryseobacterium sp.]
MHPGLFIVVFRKTAEAVDRLAGSPMAYDIGGYLQPEQILHDMLITVQTYFRLWTTVEILRGDEGNGLQSHGILRFALHGSAEDKNDAAGRLHAAAREHFGARSKRNTVEPIHLHYPEGNKHKMLHACCLVPEYESRMILIYVETTCPRGGYNAGDHQLQYLAQLLEQHRYGELPAARNLAAANHKTYAQFRQDSLQFFGTTFYQFHLKARMADVVSDLLFTDLNYKQIAYKHGFTAYNSMYHLFHRRYYFPLNKVSRLRGEQ